MLQFEPFQKKLIAVLNKRIATGRAMNALAHMTLGLAGSVEKKEELRLREYKDADQGIHPPVSDIPFIILEADNSNKIREVRNRTIAEGIEFVDFTHTMIGETYVQQHEKTSKTREEDIEYYGIVLFGDWKKVSEIT